MKLELIFWYLKVGALTDLQRELKILPTTNVKKSTMDEHLKILTDSSIIINRIAFLLDQNNIPSMTKDNVESARLAGFGISPNEVALYVYSSDVERATKIIEEFKKQSSSN